MASSAGKWQNHEGHEDHEYGYNSNRISRQDAKTQRTACDGHSPSEAKPFTVPVCKHLPAREHDTLDAVFAAAIPQQAFAALRLCVTQYLQGRYES